MAHGEAVVRVVEAAVAVRRKREGASSSSLYALHEELDELAVALDGLALSACGLSPTVVKD